MVEERQKGGDALGGQQTVAISNGRLISSPRQTAVHESAHVKVCGCRPHDGGAAHTGAGVRKPPKEETAGGVERLCVRRYGDLTAVVPECEHNFCDMARTLRMGENTFRLPCNFKELRVVKRAHIATFALCA